MESAAYNHCRPIAIICYEVNILALPACDHHGDLPVGLHRASLTEVLERFGKESPKRALLSRHLERVYGLAVRSGHLRRFVLFGSFITSKAEPNDIDVFLLMEDSFEVDQTRGEARLLFNNASAQAYFGASIFWLRRLAVVNSEQAAVDDWQIKRDGGRRGIVEIVSE